MSITFRDESNESSSTMISYNDATVTASTRPLIMLLKALLATAYGTVP